MYDKHQNESKGDMSFMESLLPENIKAYHMDSYNHKEGKRFQGSFYSNYKNDDIQFPNNECPLDILKQSRKYQMNICNCLGNRPHIVWTIWF
jgi:hypothetical protein